MRSRSVKVTTKDSGMASGILRASWRFGLILVALIIAAIAVALALRYH